MSESIIPNIKKVLKSSFLRKKETMMVLLLAIFQVVMEFTMLQMEQYYMKIYSQTINIKRLITT